MFLVHIVDEEVVIDPISKLKPITGSVTECVMQDGKFVYAPNEDVFIYLSRAVQHAGELQKEHRRAQRRSQLKGLLFTDSATKQNRQDAIMELPTKLPKDLMQLEGEALAKLKSSTKDSDDSDRLKWLTTNDCRVQWAVDGVHCQVRKSETNAAVSAIFTHWRDAVDEAMGSKL